jgi:hypothetical protein
MLITLYVESCCFFNAENCDSARRGGGFPPAAPIPGMFRKPRMLRQLPPNWGKCGIFEVAQPGRLNIFLLNLKAAFIAGVPEKNCQTVI